MKTKRTANKSRTKRSNGVGKKKRQDKIFKKNSSSRKSTVHSRIGIGADIMIPGYIDPSKISAQDAVRLLEANYRIKGSNIPANVFCSIIISLANNVVWCFGGILKKKCKTFIEFLKNDNGFPLIIPENLIWIYPDGLSKESPIYWSIYLDNPHNTGGRPFVRNLIFLSESGFYELIYKTKHRTSNTDSQDDPGYVLDSLELKKIGAYGLCEYFDVITPIQFIYLLRDEMSHYLSGIENTRKQLMTTIEYANDVLTRIG